MSESSFDRNSIELLGEEFVARYRKGERPPLSEYTQRYPALAAEIVDLFPAMLLMENLKPADDSLDAEQGQRADRNADPPFTQLGDYRIIREVGRGGMGVVYEAEQVSLGRHVALKVLPTEMHANAKHRLRFEREARAAAKLHHTNIVPVFGVGFEEQQCYYVMQFIQGQALDKILEELHRMNVQPGAAAGRVLSGSLERGPSQLIATGSVATDGPVDSRSAAGAFAHMLLTGVFHESDIESADGPIDGGTDSFAATIVPEMSQERLKDQRHDEKPPVRPKCDVQNAADGRQEQSRSAASGRHSTLTAKSSDSLRLSNSSISLSGRSGERSTKTTKQPTYWESVARIGLQVAEALEYAHSQGVLHRDIKPANLVLDMKGTVWVTDFGLARLQDERDLTRTGDILGTLRYMAPEVFKGRNDARSELYALGLTLYELLALRPAFDGHSRNALIDQVMHAEVEPLGRINLEIPPDLQTVIHKAIARDPQDRYQTAGELADDLQRFMDDEPIRARRISTIERMKRWSRHNRGLSTALTAVAVLLLVINVAGPLLTWRMVRLNSELRQSEERLSTTVVKLTSTAEELTKARNEAVRQAEQADIAKLESLTMLADMQTERGLQAAREGQSATAALWFANAVALTPHDPDRQRANHLRAASWMNEALAPAALLKLPDGDARRFEFQPNGSLLLTVSGTTLRVWDWRNEVVLLWSEALADVTDAVWSPDGKQLAVGFGTADVRIFDPVSGDELKKFRHSERVELIEWSPDGTRLAVGNLHVQIWSIVGVPLLQSDWPHPQKVFGLGFNHSGTRLVTSCDDDFARVFAVDDASLPAPIFAPVEHVRVKDFPVNCTGTRNAVFLDDHRFATVSGSARQAILRDSATGQSVTPGWTSNNLSAHLGILVSPEGRWVAAADGQRAILVEPDGQRIELRHSNFVISISFAKDGRSLVTTCWDGVARRWPLHESSDGDVSAGSPDTLPQQATLAMSTFSPDGSRLAISASRQVVIWERSQSQLVAGRIDAPGYFWRPRPGFDGQFVTPGVLHESSRKTEPRGGTLHVARMTDGQPAGPPITLDGLLVDSCLCADHRSVAAATVNGTTGSLGIFDVASGAPAIPSIVLPDVPISVAARPGHPEVAVLSLNGKLLVIETTDGKTKLDLSHEGWSGEHTVARVAWSPDGATLLTVTPNSLLFIRDAQTGKLRFPVLQPVLQGGPCRAIAFSADSRLLATAVCGRNMVQVWDLTTGEKVGREMPHSGDMYGLFSVAFSPDGQRILTGHKDGNARLWDWMTGKVVGTPMKHPDEVFDAQFTPDGRHVVTAVRHYPPQVWDVATGKPAAPLPQSVPAGGEAESLAITGDRVVVTAGNQFTMLDLSLLRQEPAEELPTLLTRAELATNHQQQLGELVPLEQQEWSARWEQLATARQTPHSVTGFLDSSLRRFTQRSLSDVVKITPPAPIPESPDFQQATHSEQLAMQGKWAEAAKAEEESMQNNPPNRAMFAFTAATLMLAGDVEGHRKFCERALKPFEPVTAADVADSLCKSCLLAPDAVSLDHLPIKVLRDGIVDPKYEALKAYFIACHTLVLYRTGLHAEAIEETKKIPQLTNVVGALALISRAMAEEKLGQHEQAVQTLFEAESIVPAELSTLGTDKHKGNAIVSRETISSDWLIPEVLRREAALLIRRNIQPLQPPADNLDATNEVTREPADRTQE